MGNLARPSKYFDRKFDPDNPGLILFLLDQSASMDELLGGEKKCDIAARAINQTIEALIGRCVGPAGLIDKVFIGVIGYGESIRYELNGRAKDLNVSHKRVAVERVDITDSSGAPHPAQVEYKVWVEPHAENSTPMAEALVLAAENIADWVSDYPEAPPPVVVNVTDGVPNDLQNGGNGGATRAAAAKLRAAGGPEEMSLLLNVHIGDATRLLFPTAASQLKDKYQQLLFDISSVVPDELLDLARRKELVVPRGSRLMAANATPEELLKILNFGSSVPLETGGDDVK
jgi:hypothetical protein